jgi:8-oxo-dGTP diphosphatase
MPAIGRPSEPKAGFAVAVDLAVLTILDGILEAFLVRRPHSPFEGCLSLPGGLVDAQEDVDEAAARVFGGATGLPLPYIEQLGTYGATDRDPRLRVISVAYLVLLPLGARPTLDPADATGGFFPVNPLIASSPASPTLAFDHRRIIADAVDRARSKLEYTTLGATLLPDEFTLGDLRRVYESVWGVGLHHSNFARKVRSVDGFVEPTGRRAAASGAPELFRKGPAVLMMPALMRP